VQCIRALTEDDELLKDIMLNESRVAFQNMLRDMAEHNKRQVRVCRVVCDCR
jgi:hypothetical protein